jgi:hypothetical protein
LGATKVGSKLVFAGGYTGSTYTAAVDIYNGGSWSTATLSVARYNEVISEFELSFSNASVVLDDNLDWNI